MRPGAPVKQPTIEIIRIIFANLFDKEPGIYESGFIASLSTDEGRNSQKAL